MKRTSMFISVVLSGVATLAAAGASADLKITTSVKVTNQPTTGGLVAASGLYLTEYHKNFARTELPNGLYRIFDFDKKLVWTVDPSNKTFYQLSLDSFLKLASNLPGTINPRRFEPSLGSTFRQAEGQAPKTVSGFNVIPFDAIALGTVEPKTAAARRSGGGGGGGHRRGGGGVFGGGGGNGGSTPPADPGSGSSPINTNDYTVKSFGQLWMAKPATADVSPLALMIPQMSLVLPYAPALKNLIDGVRKSNLLPVESDFTIEHGLVTATNPAPVISSTITSIESTTTHPEDFVIPAGFLKVDSPASLWPS